MLKENILEFDLDVLFHYNGIKDYSNFHSTIIKYLNKIGYNYNIYLNDFQKFGENLYLMGKELNIPIINLGKGKDYNMITNISKRYE